ncbi:GIY-YIG nuclease family protein [Streptococcus suis]|uniref:GIY-YIG nuclease family protein n=1 Tax=Streptococcus suis TaxID=1307 RepID=UPI001479355B
MVQHTIIVSDNGRDSITVYTKEPCFVVIATRTDMNALKNLNEAQKAGIYILLGEEKRYIGQASTSIYSRLYLHNKDRDWWNQVIFFGREDGHLDKSQLDFLESKLIKEFQETGFVLDNATQGNSSWIDKISKIHAENVWNIAQNVLEEVANINIFETPSLENSSENMEIDGYAVIFPDGHTVLGKNPTGCYVNTFKHLLESPDTAEKVRELIINGEPSSKHLLGTLERFDKSGMRLTSHIAPQIYLYNNLSTADKKRVLTRFVQSIGISITIHWD